MRKIQLAVLSKIFLWTHFSLDGISQFVPRRFPFSYVIGDASSYDVEDLWDDLISMATHSVHFFEIFKFQNLKSQTENFKIDQKRSLWVAN